MRDALLALCAEDRLYEFLQCAEVFTGKIDHTTSIPVELLRGNYVTAALMKYARLVEQGNEVKEPFVAWVTANVPDGPY